MFYVIFLCSISITCGDILIMKIIYSLIHSKGLESDHADPTLTQTIHGNISKVMGTVPPELRNEMNGK